MDIPKKINYARLRNSLSKDELEKTASTPVINRSRLVKVAGGLYRIRENYESIWKMEGGEDGKQYIVCADGTSIGEKSPQRFRLAEDDPEENLSKAAYRVIKLGKVYVAWECDECDSPNLTKEGEAYECGRCHHKYADVFGKESKTVYTKEEARQAFGYKVANKMSKEGLNKAHVSLIELWKKESEYQPKTGEPCSCKPGVHRDNCPHCEGTGSKIDFKKIRDRKKKALAANYTKEAIWPLTERKIPSMDPNTPLSQIPWKKPFGGYLYQKITPNFTIQHIPGNPDESRPGKIWKRFSIWDEPNVVHGQSPIFDKTEYFNDWDSAQKWEGDMRAQFDAMTIGELEKKFNLGTPGGSASLGVEPGQSAPPRGAEPIRLPDLRNV